MSHLPIMHLSFYSSSSFRSKNPEPGDVCHICQGPLLEQTFFSLWPQTKFPHQTRPLSPLFHTGSQINKSPCTQRHRSIPAAHQCGEVMEQKPRGPSCGMEMREEEGQWVAGLLLWRDVWQSNDGRTVSFTDGELATRASNVPPQRPSLLFCWYKLCLSCAKKKKSQKHSLSEEQSSEDCTLYFEITPACEWGL